MHRIVMFEVRTTWTCRGWLFCYQITRNVPTVLTGRLPLRKSGNLIGNLEYCQIDTLNREIWGGGRVENRLSVLSEQLVATKAGPLSMPHNCGLVTTNGRLGSTREACRETPHKTPGRKDPLIRQTPTRPSTYTYFTYYALADMQGPHA